MAKNKQIRFGMKCTDIVTGFSGIVTGFAEYITGCKQWNLVSKVDKEGKSKDEWVDEDRLKIVTGGLSKLGRIGILANGGPTPKNAPKGG